MCAQARALLTPIIYLNILHVKTFVGGKAYLMQKGAEVVVLENKQCQDLMQAFVDKNPIVRQEYSSGS